MNKGGIRVGEENDVRVWIKLHQGSTLSKSMLTFTVSVVSALQTVDPTVNVSLSEDKDWKIRWNRKTKLN